MKATKENVTVGTKVTYTNKFNYTTSGTITKISDKSVWLNGMRNSWNTLSKFDIYLMDVKQSSENDYLEEKIKKLEDAQK